MSLPIVLFLSLYFLSHLQLRPVSAHPEESNSDSISNIKIGCPNSFTCGSFGTLYFPFSNQTDTQCGLCSVSCDEEHPVQMYLVNDHFLFVNITQISSEANGRGKIELINTSFKADLEAKNCRAFRDLGLPNTPFISFSIPHNLTLFQCNRNSFQFSPPMDDPYFNYTRCEDHDDIYYYKYPDDDVSATANVFRECHPIQLPAEGSEKVEPGDRADPFNLLNATYSIELHVPEDCLKCHQRGGQCLNRNQKFQCTIKKRSSHKLNIIIILGIGTTALVAMILLFY